MRARVGLPLDLDGDEAGDPLSERIHLGGQEFVPIGESTVEHDNMFWRLQEKSGLRLVVLEPHEDAEAFARRLLQQLMGNEAFFELLGCLIVPANKTSLDWTPEMMRETAELVKKLHAPEDKARVHSLALSVVIDFFAEGLTCLESFRSSSPAEPSGTTEVALPGGATESGKTSSVESPEATPLEPARS